ncbi:uncharacterized protein LOC108908896 [Anoplophora glabripennis]|uniref:uncharacterized protein LOC108908896 n=1 Tax=Anoplophora glabripennis TaxID=217634 RepID=UPI000873B33C|nr:uncharacterized protein LOC108908896 [Anoplophora glabripennis]
MGSNHTEYVEDPFGDLDEEYLKYFDREPVYLALSYVVLVTSIVKIILCLCVIVVDILLIYVITKFKRLQSTVNGYIKHYAIFNILYLAASSLVYITSTYFCLGFQIDYASLLFSFLFAFALGLDWLVMTFKPELGLKIKNGYKHLTLSIYILGCVKFLVGSGLCFTVHSSFHVAESTTLTVIYISILLFLLVLDCLNFRHRSSIRPTKTVYSLTVANIIVLFWLPMFVYRIWHKIQTYEEVTELIFWYTEFIPELISSSISIVILVVLVRANKNFRMAFAKIFKRSVRHYSNEGENLDESDDETTYPRVDSNVFYHNATTCVKI